METVSGRRLAAELGVTENSVRTAAKAGRIVREKDGRFDLVKARTDWVKSTEPSRSRVRNEPAQNSQTAQSEQAAQEDRLGILASMLSYEDRADRSAVAVALYTAHHAGSLAALTAIDAGASVKVAFAIEHLYPVVMMEVLEYFLESIGIAPAALRYRPDTMKMVAWDVVAAGANEPYVPADWVAWVEKRTAMINAAPV